MRQTQCFIPLFCVLVLAAAPLQAETIRVMSWNVESDGNDPKALAAFIQREQPRLDRDDVARITCPTLVIIGDKDFSGPGDVLAEALPNGTLIELRNVDHFGLPKSFDFVDKGLEFLGAVPDF